MQASEYREMQDITKNIKDISNSIKKLDSTITKADNNTNKKSMTFKLLDAIKSLDSTMGKSSADIVKALEGVISEIKEVRTAIKQHD